MDNIFAGTVQDFFAPADARTAQGARAAQTQRPVIPTVQSRGQKLWGTVGRIADMMAALGGEEPAYRARMERDAANTRKQAQQNYLATIFQNPENEVATQEYLRSGGDLGALAMVREMNAPEAPRAEGSLPREVLIARMLEDPNTSPAVKARLEQMVAPKPVAPPAPILRSTPGGGTAIVDPTTRQFDVIIPGREPAAASGGTRGAPALGMPPGPIPAETAAAMGLDPRIRWQNVRGKIEPIGGAAAITTANTEDRGGLSQADFGKAKARLGSLPAIRNAIKAVEAANDGLKGTNLTGPIGGRVPAELSQAADVFEKAVSNLRSQIRGLTKVAGEGSISDFETRLNNATMPERMNTPEGRKEALRLLNQLTDDVEKSYRGMIAPRRAATPAPAAGGWGKAKVVQ
jgi:hypothetical protein